MMRMTLTDEQKQRIRDGVKWAWTDMAFKAPEMQPPDPVEYIAQVAIRYLERA